MAVNSETFLSLNFCFYGIRFKLTVLLEYIHHFYDMQILTSENSVRYTYHACIKSNANINNIIMLKIIYTGIIGLALGLNAT